MTSKKSPLSRSSTKIFGCDVCQSFLPPPPLSKTVPLVTPNERRQLPKDRENLRGGYIYSYTYSELGLVLDYS